MSTYIPTELFENILYHVLNNVITNVNPGETQKPKPSWNLLDSISLSCRTLRLIALKLWFRYLYIKSPMDLQDISRLFPDLKSSWARHLHCVQTEESTEMLWDLAGFKRLSTVRIDWLHQHLTLIKEHEIIPFINVECPVKELDIQGLRYPTPMILTALTRSFVDVVTLKLDCLRVWCGLCHTCTLVRFPFPAPKEFVYEDGFGLPIHYAWALFALNALENVFLTLPDIGSVFVSSDMSADSNENMWAGECDRCMSIMYQDAVFTKSWLDRKRGIAAANLNNRAVYVKLPSLRKVHWKFWKYEPGSGSKPHLYDEEELGTDDDFSLEAESAASDSSGEGGVVREEQV